MEHTPVESIIFNSYTSMVKNAVGEKKRFLKKMGHTNYKKLVIDMMNNKADPKADAYMCAEMTMQNVVALTMAARKAFGRERLTTATKSCEFLRVIFGSDQTEVAAGGGYYCQTCGTQPKYDFQWTVATGCGALSGWFCPKEGCPYDTQRMAGLITFEDKKDASSSFVMNTRMAEGSTANMLSTMKLVNVIRNGECKLSNDDVRRAGGLGTALRNMIGGDNELYHRLFSKLRGVAVPGHLHAPNVDRSYYPHFKVCEGENDVTLRTADFGRPFVMYDVNQLFDGAEPAEASDGAWRGIVQVILSAWGLAEACALHPDMNTVTSLSKKVVKNLTKWTHIRATGKYPLSDDEWSLTEASESDKAWAAQDFDEF